MYDWVLPMDFPIPFSLFLDHGVRLSATTMTMFSSSSDDDCGKKTRQPPISEFPPWQGHTLKRIVVHYGPIPIDHSAYLGSKYNVLVEWNNCRYSIETLENIIGRDLMKALQYSNDCGLFNDSMWSNHFPEHIKRQIPRIHSPNQSNPLRHDLDHCRAIATAVRKSFDQCMDYHSDDSCRNLRDGVCEIFVGTLLDPDVQDACYAS
jgi:hypothetical protein